MKNIAYAAAVALFTTQAFAGNIVAPVMEPEVVEQETTRSGGGLLIPVLLLVLLAAAVSSGGGNGGGANGAGRELVAQ